MYKASVSSGSIGKDLENVKKIVKIFKKSVYNANKPEGFDLLQEVPTRFFTTFDVVQRFLKVEKFIQGLFEAKNSATDATDKVQAAFDALLFEQQPGGSTSYPELEEIDIFFAPKLHAQKNWKLRSIRPSCSLFLSWSASRRSFIC